MLNEEYVKNEEDKDALKDPSQPQPQLSCPGDVTTSSLCCSCDDCVKYYGHGKPVQCIDSYLIDTRNLQHQVNIIRNMLNEEYVKNEEDKDALKDPSQPQPQLSCPSDVTTSSLCCSCDDCVKYYGHGKPVQCIDPYLIDIRYTREVYSETNTTRTPGDSASTKASPGTSDEETKIEQHKN